MSARDDALALVGDLLERLGASGARELEVRTKSLRVKVSRAEPEDDRPPGAQTEGVEGSFGLTGAATRTSRDVSVRGPREGSARPRVGIEVTAPLTGIFYRSPSPQAQPFVQIGTPVAVGDAVGLIEAMKLFNEVRSTVAGRVKRIVAENGQLVRAHQPLFELE